MISRSGVGLRLVVAGLLAMAGALPAVPAVAAGTTTGAVEENWLMTAHQSNLAEIAAGQDAQRYATRADVRSQGDELVDDHRDLDTTVASLARKYDVFLPPLPSEAQRRALSSLQNKEGEAYDAAWVRHEIGSHEAIIAAGQKVIREGQSPDVVAAAREAQPVLQSHLNDLNAIAADLGLSQPATVTGGTGGQAAAAAAAATTRPAAMLTALGVVLLGAGVVTARRRRAA